jgi:WhiB family redox-sensing transcriptional regulator
MKLPKDDSNLNNFKKKLLNSISNWRSEALCINDDSYSTQDFFDLSETNLKNLAKKACFNCPVQSHCLYTSLISQEQFGLWGGLTSKQRKAFMRYISVKAQEQGIDPYTWSREYNEFIQDHCDIQKVKEAFKRNN